MGFDLYGEAPAAKDGGYFRNNVWWWRPLWQYVCNACPGVLTKRDGNEGCHNNGHLISATKAQRIAQRLRALLASGDVKRYERQYRARLRALPLETCERCRGAGTRNDKPVKGRCNACDGRGKREAWATHYPFSADNVREFAEFCQRSGGFRIC